MYLKRQKIPTNWPIKRKGTAYVVRPNFNIQTGIPILLILRDMLKIAQNRKEVKTAIHLKQILLNGEVVRDEKNSALLFDVISIAQKKQNYRLELSKKGIFNLKGIEESESNYKIAKIINKKILKGKKIQLNLSDGINLISNIKCEVNDSVLVGFKDKKKIIKCFPLKENSKIIVFSGKHSGKRGIINKIDKKNKIIELSVGDQKINVLIKQLMAIG